MKIKFKNTKLLFDLLSALFLIVISTLLLIEKDHLSWFNFGFFILGISLLIKFVFNLTQHYITIEGGIIKRNGFLGYNEKILLKDIIEIKIHAGYYILFTTKSQLRIRIILIADDSLVDLKHILSELKIPVDKTPFFKSK